MSTLDAPRALAMLDRQLAAKGKTATLRKTVPNGSPVDIAVRIKLSDYKPQELAGPIIQGDSKVVLSPTEIIAANWPGGAATGNGTDKRVPVNGDKIIIAGRTRNIEAASPVYLDDALVRIDLQVRG